MTLIPNLGLSAEALEERIDYFNASEAPELMAGWAEEIVANWLFHTRQAPGKDLSRNLQAALGTYTTRFNCHWHTVQTGRDVTEMESVRYGTNPPWMRCTLDGMTTTAEGAPAVYEAKHTGEFMKIDKLVQFYMPQVHHSMHIVGVQHAVMGILVGNSRWECFEIEQDPFYTAELIDRERAFWECVQTRSAPPEWHAIQPPAPPSEWRTVDMTGSNAWAMWAGTWLIHRGPAKQFETAGKELRSLVEPDVGLAYGHGVRIERKGGKLYLKEHNDE